MFASRNAFNTAFAGAPPKAKAEINTPVSMTTLCFGGSGVCADAFYGLFDISGLQTGFPE